MNNHPRKPKLTDAERHKRFVEVAKKIGASEDIVVFDEAFKRVVCPSRSNAGRPKRV
jgi:hypothetical protein